MAQLDKKLRRLAHRSITEQERERRMRQLESLASKKVQLDARFQNTPSSSTRALFQATSFLDDDDPILQNNNAPIETLRTEQVQMIQEQDKGLESLSQTISRQKKLAMKIGTEIEDQNGIIDNITVQMDNTANGVRCDF